MITLIARILGLRRPEPKLEVLVDSQVEPQDLDDPFLDERARKRVGQLISKSRPETL